MTQHNNPWRHETHTDNSVPKTLSPRIKTRDREREAATETRMKRDDDLTPQKFMINQRSSDTNFHNALDVSEEQTLDRRLQESNSNEEPDFA